MGRIAKTKEEIVADLLELANPNGECLECHLAASFDRPNRARHYIMVGGRGGQRIRASRLVYEVVIGPIGDLFVLHTCDNQLCINPEHLFLGTAMDNTQDMISKGRKVEDPEVGLRRRKVTARRIFNLTWEGHSDDEVCKRAYISKSTLWNYRKGGYSQSIFAGD